MAPARPRKHLVLTLDAFSTLYTPRQPIATQYLSLARSCNLSLPYHSSTLESELSQAFRAAFKAMYARSPNYGRATGMRAEEWWDGVVRATFSPLLLPASSSSSSSSSAAAAETEEQLSLLSRRLYAHFSTSAAYTLFPDAQNLFSHLRTLRSRTQQDANRNIVVGVVTNSDPRVTSVLRSLGLTVGDTTPPPPHPSQLHSNDNDQQQQQQPDIDFVITSYGCGAEKPTAAIFACASSVAATLLLARNNNTANMPVGAPAADERVEVQHVHIGDDHAKDVVGARGVGWDVLYLDRKGGDGVAPPNQGEQPPEQEEEGGGGEDARVATITRLDCEVVLKEVLGGYV